MMDDFSDIKQDTPRLVVEFHRDGDREVFKWGIVGAMPAVTLIGCVARVQMDLLTVPGTLAQSCCNLCPESALVIVWDEELKEFDWFVHPDIPVNSLAGMLELVKTALIGMQATRMAAQQRPNILSPNGVILRG